MTSGYSHRTGPAGHQIRDREAEHFDRLVQREGDFNPFADRGWRTLARRFRKVVPTTGLRLLDVGCGTGQSRRIYDRAIAAYTGIDLSLEALRAGLRRNVQPSSWLQADALRLPFASASFDVVAFSSVLHHLPNRRLALLEARRVVRPGGWIFAFDPNVRHPAMLLLRHPRSPFHVRTGVSPNEQPLSPTALKADFRATGFDDIGQRCQSDIPYRHVMPTLLRPLLPIYNACDWAWERIGAGRWFGTFVVTWGCRGRS